ncbi:Uncharacterised protein [Bordetella pertussis]|nr:Uncharacterised protein [Bordetella pertussis]CFW32214.1 Uncharacterised protein [Bordetella pertussis]
MHLSCPDDNAGLSRLDASSVPPEAEPAPIRVWISSMNRIASGLPRICLSTPLRRCSKSPRYLVPASKAPMSSAKTCAVCSTSGTSPRVMRQARPSAMAVLPTPASPTSSGLFLRRRHNTWMTRSTSCSRPIRGSMRPASAAAFRSLAYWSSGDWRDSAPGSSPLACCSLGSAEDSSCGCLVMPCDRKLTTSSRVTPCCCR